MKKKTIAILTTVVAAAAGAFVLAPSFRDKNREPEPPRPVAVRVALPRTEDMEIGASYLGTVRSRRDLRVIARIPGTVSQLPRREGERAREGELLALLAAPETQAQIERLTADRDYWAQRYEADTRLLEKKAIAPDQALAGERSLKTTQAALKEARSQLEKTRETAPFDGVVLSWLVEPGQSVMPGQAILNFGSDDREILVEAAEEDLRRGLGRGSEAEVETPGGGKIRARVSEVSPAASGASRTFTVRIPLPGTGSPSLPVGASLRVTFVTAARKGALTLPSPAVADRNRDPHIFLVRDGRAHRQTVEAGIESRGRIVVDFPWNGLDKVVVSDPGALADGVEVFAVDAGGDEK